MKSKIPKDERFDFQRGWAFISGYCYESGETHPDDPCLIAKPEESDVKWSQNVSICV